MATKGQELAEVKKEAELAEQARQELLSLGPIRDSNAQEFFASVLVQLHEKKKSLTDFKKKVLDPINDALKKARAEFDKPLKLIESNIDIVKQAIVEYDEHLDRERLGLQEAAYEATQKEDHDEVLRLNQEQTLIERKKELPTGLHYRTSWTWEVQNENHVKEGFWKREIDKKAIEEVVKKHGPDASLIVGGIVVKQKKIVVPK